MRDGLERARAAMDDAGVARSFATTLGLFVAVAAVALPVTVWRLRRYHSAEWDKLAMASTGRPAVAVATGAEAGAETKSPGRPAVGGFGEVRRPASSALAQPIALNRPVARPRGRPRLRKR